MNLNSSDIGHYLKDTLADPLRRFRWSLLLLVLLVAVGTAGFMTIEHMGFVDSLYMAVIAITTVGFGEVHPLSQAGRLFTIAYLIMGVGAAAWAITTGAEVVLGEKLWMSVQQRKLHIMLTKLEGHFIICGYGRLGRPIARDMRTRGEKFVVVELSPTNEEEFLDAGVPFVIGDAAREDVLRRAGVERARGIVVTLDSDAENVLAVLTARELNPGILIVARANNESAESKMRRAGADRVISPDAMGGRRLALALMQPKVHDFLEKIFNLEELEVNVGQVFIGVGSPLAGQTIEGSDLRSRHNLTVLAVQTPGGEFIVSPDQGRILEPGETLIVIGPPEAIDRLGREIV